MISNKQLSVKIGEIFDDDFQELKSVLWEGFAKKYHAIQIRLMHAQRTQLVRIVLF